MLKFEQLVEGKKENMYLVSTITLFNCEKWLKIMSELYVGYPRSDQEHTHFKFIWASWTFYTNKTYFYHIYWLVDLSLRMTQMLLDGFQWNNVLVMGNGPRQNSWHFGLRNLKPRACILSVTLLLRSLVTTRKGSGWLLPHMSPVGPGMTKVSVCSDTAPFAPR